MTRVGEWITDAYRRQVETPPTPFPGFRGNAVESILENFFEFLAPPRKRFPASLAPGGKIHSGGVEIPEPVGLSARFWGVGYEFEELAHSHSYSQALLRESVRRLTSDLDGVRKLETWLAEKEGFRGELPIGGTRPGRELERLFLDVLLLEGQRVRPATLEEDVREATDLRLRVEGGPSRGIRIQVTWTARPERLERS